MPSGRDSFRRNRVAPLPVFYHVYMRFLRCRTNSNENAGSPRSAFRASLEPQSLARLKRLQKRDQIVFVLLREMQAEPGVIKIERVHKRRGGAIVKVWRATCQPLRIGPLNLPMSAHFPVTIARPMSVTWVITPVELHITVKSGRSDVRREPSTSPILSGAGTEWSPTFGESWQVPQKPSMVSVCRTSLSPATPVIGIFSVLKRFWPRAMARRAAACSSSSSWVCAVKICVSKLTIC